jgi:hypothetical protein
MRCYAMLCDDMRCYAMLCDATAALVEDSLPLVGRAGEQVGDGPRERGVQIGEARELDAEGDRAITTA